jgi:hypothetical protein
MRIADIGRCLSGARRAEPDRGTVTRDFNDVMFQLPQVRWG